MSDILVKVPTINPKRANTMSSEFLTTIKLNLNPSNEYQFVAVSIIAGKASPSADKHKAPKRDMNNPRLGMATARRTETKCTYFNIISNCI